MQMIVNITFSQFIMWIIWWFMTHFVLLFVFWSTLQTRHLLHLPIFLDPAIKTWTICWPLFFATFPELFNIFIHQWDQFGKVHRFLSMEFDHKIIIKTAPMLQIRTNSVFLNITKATPLSRLILMALVYEVGWFFVAAELASGSKDFRCFSFLQMVWMACITFSTNIADLEWCWVITIQIFCYNFTNTSLWEWKLN